MKNDYRTLLLLITVAIVVFCIAYFAPVAEETSDPFLSLVVSQAILEHHTIKLDEYVESIPAYLQSWRVIHWKQHAYYYFPVGPSVFSIPFVWVANHLGRDMRNVSTDLKIQNAISALLCAMAVVGIYLLIRIYLKTTHSLLVAAVSMLGSSLISTMGAGLWNVDFTVIFSLLTLYFLLGRQFALLEQLKPYLVGALLFAGYFCRPTNSIFIGLILVYILLKKRDWFLRTVLVLGALMLIFVAWSYVEYGTRLPPYYTPKFDTVNITFRVHPTWLPPHYRLNYPSTLSFFEILNGILFSPSRGFFVYNPLFGAVLLAAVLNFAHLRREPIFWLSLTWIILTILVVSRFSPWWGGGCFGPRLLTEIVPAFSVILILLWRDLLTRAKAFYSRLGLACFVILGATGIYINSYAGLFNVQTFLWGGISMPPMVGKAPEYIFDWRYPQILATEQSNCSKNYDYIMKLIEGKNLLITPYSLGETIEYAAANHRVFTPFGFFAQPGEILMQQGTSVNVPSSIGEVSTTNAAFIGWSYPENGGVWSQCRKAMIVFGKTDFDPTGKPYTLQIISGSNGNQPVQVQLNGIQIGEIVFEGETSTRLLNIDGSLLRQFDLNWLVLNVPGTANPGGGEKRSLGLFFQTLQILPAK